MLSYNENNIICFYLLYFRLYQNLLNLFYNYLITLLHQFYNKINAYTLKLVNTIKLKYFNWLKNTTHDGKIKVQFLFSAAINLKNKIYNHNLIILVKNKSKINKRNSVIGKMLVSWSGDIGSSPVFAFIIIIIKIYYK